MPERTEQKLINLRRAGEFQVSIVQVNPEGQDAGRYSELMGANNKRVLSRLVKGRVTELVKNSQQNAKRNQREGRVVSELLTRASFVILRPGERIEPKLNEVRSPMLTEAERRLRYPEEGGDYSIQPILTPQTWGRELVGVGVNR